MDPRVIGVFIPIVAMVGFFSWMIAISPLGKAFAERLRNGPRAAGTAEDQGELLESVEQLRREVAELAERVDFTERLLGQHRAAEQLEKPRS
jgi:uncharacterized protein YlxW (UPF0749 family)